MKQNKLITSLSFDLLAEINKSANLMDGFFSMERKYSMGDLKLDYKIANDWTKNGLIDDNRKDKKNGWRKFNDYDRLWVLIIQDLKKLGISTEKLLKVKGCLHKKFDFQDKEYSLLHYAIMRYITIKSKRTSLIVSDDVGLSLEESPVFIETAAMTLNLTNLLDRLNKCGSELT